ncbi:hypothetical protein Ahy_B01g055803 isoform J [Arachis hypogaea]|uniref:Replication factor A C-terminal domain-containing protein n=1 Tax=Arachis hypogaea TaxID=3818 RepID=A0A445AX46_ARAHY|nr:hypothetical protein Ahy_B01g055803 isoform J [Arachis hypogaea]
MLHQSSLFFVTSFEFGCSAAAVGRFRGIAYKSPSETHTDGYLKMTWPKATYTPYQIFHCLQTIKKYKPTNHAQQIYFKRDTQIRTVQDNSFPINMFQFVPNELILNHTNAQSHFIGTMGISNTNYNSILHINANRKEVKEFRQSIIMSGVPPANRLSQLAAKPIYNLEDDLINQSTYKSISELKETIEESDPNQKQGGNFATIGVVAIDPKNGWWYNINMRVADDTEAASFLLYDTEAVKHLGVTTSDIRLAQLTKGGINEKYQTELNSLVGQKFLFKVAVKMEDLNAF